MNPCARAAAARLTHLILAAMALLTFPLAGHAATITTDIAVKATHFESFEGTSPPVVPVIGSFRVTLDPTQTVFDSTSISTLSLNIKVDGDVVFDYIPGNSILTIGGRSAGAGGLFFGTNDFSLGLLYDGSAFNVLYLTYSQEGIADAFFYQPAVVPLPGALPLFASALGGMSFVGWYRKRRRMQRELSIIELGQESCASSSPRR
jgi:hypothetical protein